MKGFVFGLAIDGAVWCRFAVFAGEICRRTADDTSDRRHNEVRDLYPSLLERRGDWRNVAGKVAKVSLVGR